MNKNNDTLSMEDICFCPGKVITRKKRNWYFPFTELNKSTNLAKIYCEHCFNEYSYGLNELQFTVNNVDEHYCSSDKDFNDASIIIDNIRVSIVNPKNLYRYKKIKSTTTTAIIGIPSNEPYVIVIENCDKNTTKITISDIFHDNIENIYYNNEHSNNKENFHIIDKMSHGEPLIFNDKYKNIINLKVIKWKKASDNGSSFLTINGNPITFSIRLVKNDNCLKEINDLIAYYKSLEEQNKKIVIVNDFI